MARMTATTTHLQKEREITLSEMGAEQELFAAVDLRLTAPFAAGDSV